MDVAMKFHALVPEILITPDALSKFLGLPVNLPSTEVNLNRGLEGLPLGGEVLLKFLSI